MFWLTRYAMSLIGTPYRWGGENPVRGFDCSGLVQEILRSAGIDPPGDQTAQKLYDHFELMATSGVYAAGALAFYGKSVREITHVAFMIDQYRIVEAGGGGHLTLTHDDAGAANAFVRMRLVGYRKDLVATLKPNYSKIGVF